MKGKLPVLFRGDSTLLDEQPGIRRLLRRGMLRWIYSHVDVAFYVGSNNRAYFLMHGLSNDQLVFAPHAVDNGRFESFDRVKAQNIRREIGIEDDEVMLLFAGKLERKKAPDQLLSAFSSTPAKKGHLVFVGSGEMERSLQADEVGNVHFLGFQNQSQMPAIYGAADLMATSVQRPWRNLGARPKRSDGGGLRRFGK